MKKIHSSRIKSNSLSVLIDLERQKWNEDHPHAHLVQGFTFTATKWNDITHSGCIKCIIYFLRYKGWDAYQYDVKGTPVDKRKVVTDCLGMKRQIGSIAWRKSGATKGHTDIYASKLMHPNIYCDVKKDYEDCSHEQILFIAEKKQHGHYAFTVQTFDEFLSLYNEKLGANK